MFQDEITLLLTQSEHESKFLCFHTAGLNPDSRLYKKFELWLWLIAEIEREKQFK